MAALDCYVIKDLVQVIKIQILLRKDIICYMDWNLNDNPNCINKCVCNVFQASYGIIMHLGPSRNYAGRKHPVNYSYCSFISTMYKS